MEKIELLKSLEKRVEYIESLECIQHPTHIKELIDDLMDRVDDLMYKVSDLKDEIEELELENKRNKDLY